MAARTLPPGPTASTGGAASPHGAVYTGPAMADETARAEWTLRRRAVRPLRPELAAVRPPAPPSSSSTAWPSTSGRYAATAAALPRRASRVHAVDYRGHGRSEGRRVHVDSVDDYVADVRAALDERTPAPSGPARLPARPLAGRARGVEAGPRGRRGAGRDRGHVAVPGRASPLAAFRLRARDGRGAPPRRPAPASPHAHRRVRPLARSVGRARPTPAIRW